jgi:hypothetical protein
MFIMNSSQLLYKISNLQYSIRKKEAEYSNAVKTNNQVNIDLNNSELKLLKEDLATTVKAFNSVPAHNTHDTPKASKSEGKWWKRFLNFKTAVSKK